MLVAVKRYIAFSLLDHLYRTAEHDEHRMPVVRSSLRWLKGGEPDLILTCLITLLQLSQLLGADLRCDDRVPPLTMKPDLHTLVDRKRQLVALRLGRCFLPRRHQLLDVTHDGRCLAVVTLVIGHLSAAVGVRPDCGKVIYGMLFSAVLMMLIAIELGKDDIVSDRALVNLPARLRPDRRKLDAVRTPRREEVDEHEIKGLDGSVKVARGQR
mmetsp:Transcript_36013/g.71637  ORF Transcript_36013/g.71637 Transcript_36013/m.71637 type:complete len:212 (-) Transcript_36013:120-755(-)